MRNIFSHISSKTPALLVGLSLCAVFALSGTTEVAASVNASTLGGTINADDSRLNGNPDIILDANLTININQNKTIGQITWDDTYSNYTLTITGTETLTCKKIDLHTNNSNNPRVGTLVIQGGKLVTQELVTGYGNSCLVKSICISNGTLDAQEGVTCTSLEMSGGSLKAERSNGTATVTANSLSITGGTVDVRNVNAGTPDSAGSAIRVWGPINISGTNTVVTATTNSPSNDVYAIYSTDNNGIAISRPLAVTTPVGGGISGNGRFIATTAGGSTIAKEVVIQRDPNGGGTGGGESSKSDDDDSSEEDSTGSKPAVVNKDVLFGSNMAGLPHGAFLAKQEQGLAAKYAFAASLPNGYKSAFTFNMITNGRKPEYTLKKGSFTLTIPPEFRKAGRTFAIQALDKSGKVRLLPDRDNNPNTITVDVNLEGYAFELIYKD